MSLNEILTGIDEIRTELEKMTACLIRLGERVARIEAAQQSHNVTSISGNVVPDRKLDGPDQNLIESYFLYQTLKGGNSQVFAENTARRRALGAQQTVAAELPGEPDPSALSVEEHIPAATTTSFASPPNIPAESPASKLRELKRLVAFRTIHG